MAEHVIAELRWADPSSAASEVEMLCSCRAWSVFFRPRGYRDYLPLDEAKRDFRAHRQHKEGQHT